MSWLCHGNKLQEGVSVLAHPLLLIDDLDLLE